MKHNEKVFFRTSPYQKAYLPGVVDTICSPAKIKDQFGIYVSGSLLREGVVYDKTLPDAAYRDAYLVR